MKKYCIGLLFVLLSIVASQCTSHSTSPLAKKDQALTAYVNTFIGTGGHGHTYPGATMPFGMIQLSPDTRLTGWDGCSGYHYSDRYIYGFSHTHLSGTGVSDYGDILFMPTNSIQFNNGADGNAGYRAPFTHEKEEASPGFYKVHLDSTHIDVSLSVKERSGIHQYTFPEKSKQIIILDLTHRDQVLSSSIDTITKKEIQGHRHSKAWAEDQKLFFNVSFSRPYTKVVFLDNKTSGEKVKAAFEFASEASNIVEIRIGISSVSSAGAKNNRVTELGNKTFDIVKKEADATWEKQLEKIVIESSNKDYKTIFYTALYHSMIAPNIYQDVDGKYRGMDDKIHQNNTHTNYTVFSLWDTYRAAHPLYTIIEQKRSNDFINTFLNKYDEGGIMPIWDLSANYTGCMIGYHAVPVIADAYLKGINNYDAEKAFSAMKHSAIQDKLGLAAYKKFGFVPVEEEAESVSKTLEYAYDDWTIAQMAKALGKKKDYNYFIRRAQSYKNVFDPETQFMRGRIRNTWFSPFDPYEVNFNYTEANAWQYSFYVPQDITGFTALLGGKDQLEKHLDELFTATTQTTGRNQADITGLIGQYAHGNEPSHHMAYLYNFINKPHKTQQYVHQILTTLYTNSPNGIAGNEDCGQMSAWYVLSALGFYPVTPGSSDYIIGTPLFDKATISLENGNTFTISSQNSSEQHHYITSAQLNGKALNQSYLSHQDIVSGGSLQFVMSDRPSSWATQDYEIPKSAITDQPLISPPYIKEGAIAFKERTQISLDNTTPNATTYYAFNNDNFQKYSDPFPIEKAGKLKTYSELNGEKSVVIATDFFVIDPNKSIALHSAYANQYNGGGKTALIDGIKGGTDFRAGAWQGYFDTDVRATVNLGSLKKINSVTIGFLEDQRSWIFMPTKIRVFFSTDGKRFILAGEEVIAAENPSEGSHLKNSTFNNFPSAAQYIKIEATTLGPLPEWHLGHAHQGKSWLFLDEITIK